MPTKLKKQLRDAQREAEADGVITPEEQARIDSLHDSVVQQRRRRGSRAVSIISSIGFLLLRVIGINPEWIAWKRAGMKNENNIFLNETNTTMKSGFLKIDFKDLGRGILIAVLSVIVMSVQPVLSAGELPDVEGLKQAGILALNAGIAYLLKNLFTNSQDQFLKGEQK